MKGSNLGPCNGAHFRSASCGDTIWGSQLGSLTFAISLILAKWAPTGSAPAMTAAIGGGVMIGEMEKKGYDSRFSAALLAVGVNRKRAVSASWQSPL